MLTTVLIAAAVAAAPAPASDAAEPAPDPYVAGGLTVGVPLGVYAVSLVTPYRELMFVAPLAYGAGHLYARDTRRAMTISLGGYGAAIFGAGLAVGSVALFPGTPAESVARVVWGGALGTAGYGPFAAWDAMRTARQAGTPPE